jgi:ligand-binding sensor domain-containing protein
MMSSRPGRLALGASVLVAVSVAIVVAVRSPSEIGSVILADDSKAESVPVPVRVDPWKAPAHPVRPTLLYTRFETIGVADGLPSERVTCVLAEDDDLAVGTDRGLALRRGGVWTVIGEEQGLSHPYVTSIARHAASGDLWIGTLRGLNRLSGGRLRTYTQRESGLMNDVVYDVAVEGDLVWAATAAGASILDVGLGTWQLYDTSNSIFHEPWCYALARGPGRTWIGLWGGGIAELDHASWEWREYRDPDGEMELDLLRDDGPIHDVTSAIAYDAGVLWQATYFGLSRYDGRRWSSYTAADTGLPGDFIHHVDALGHTVWIASDQGVGVFDGETCTSYRRREDGRCDVAVWRDGSEVERHTLDTAPAHDYVLWVQGGENEAWFATARGLTHAVADPAGRDEPESGGGK